MLAGEPVNQLKADAVYGKAPVTVLQAEANCGDKYGVDGVPHTFYFDKGGHVALDLDGYTSNEFQLLEQRVASDLRDATPRTTSASVPLAR
jgi:thioredoxin-related protein